MEKEPLFHENKRQVRSCCFLHYRRDRCIYHILAILCDRRMQEIVYLVGCRSCCLVFFNFLIEITQWEIAKNEDSIAHFLKWHVEVACRSNPSVKLLLGPFYRFLRSMNQQKAWLCGCFARFDRTWMHFSGWLREQELRFTHLIPRQPRIFVLENAIKWTKDRKLAANEEIYQKYLFFWLKSHYHCIFFWGYPQVSF
jgi:hypothetical protein